MIDAQLQQSLRERFNPEGSMLRRQQMRMVEILRFVDALCRQHNIRYWLSSGTLLGAARHGGFIPWDDDLDVEMLREDFDRFVELFSGGDDYLLQTRKNDRFFMLPFAKVRDCHSVLDEFGGNRHYRHKGIFVDVFCLEPSPRFAYVGYGLLLHPLLRLANRSDTKFRLRLALMCKGLYYGSIALLKPLFKLLPFKSLNHMYGCGPRWRSRKIEEIFPLGSITFEGYEFPAPRDTDAYLRRMFGDYNALPPLDNLRVHVSECRFL